MESEMQGNPVINEERYIVMGNRKVVLYIGKECYVYSTRATDDTEYVKFTTQSPENLIFDRVGTFGQFVEISRYFQRQKHQKNRCQSNDY